MALNCGMETILSFIKRVLPEPVANFVRKLYHPFLSFAFALLSGFPARQMTIIGINGTKGKSTTAEMLYAILRRAGHKTALASTIRFAIDDDSTPNRFKMTMPGRGFLQRFLARARSKGATHAVVELTTEGAREWRHKFLFLDGLIMLNVQKEHIERFGSFEKYVEAKWGIAREVERSSKKNRAIAVCTDDEQNASFQQARVPAVIAFSKRDLGDLSTDEQSTSFSYKNTPFTIPLPGAFNAVNALAAIVIAEHFGVSLEDAKQALGALAQVKGRLEPINEGQRFRVIVDYAHTTDSLEALYGAYPRSRKVCVLGNTGGGRDAWKRPAMARVAEDNCDVVILTNEDPYDESPENIVNDMAAGMRQPPQVVMDRREAIREAIRVAGEMSSQPLASAEGSGNQHDVVVLISGKGTDPYIMEAGGKKTPWSDEQVAREELQAFLKKT